jgi:hypothetical protein
MTRVAKSRSAGGGFFIALLEPFYTPLTLTNVSFREHLFLLEQNLFPCVQKFLRVWASCG